MRRSQFLVHLSAEGFTMPVFRRVFLATVMCFASISGHGQTWGNAAPMSVRISAAGHPGSALAAKWVKQGPRDGIIEVELESALAAVQADVPSAPMELEVTVAPRSSRTVVRQRSVSYLNVSDDGPHMAVPGSDQRGPWRTLALVSGDRFGVHPIAEQIITIRPRQFAAALGNDARWAELVKTCTSAKSGPCYTVTDVEFEVTTTNRLGRKSRAIIRVAFPNGC